MRKKLIILGSTIILTAGIAAAYASSVLINADKQTYNEKEKQMSFDGNVKATYENMSVTSPKALMKTGPDGKPESAVFINGTAVKQTPNNKSEVKANIIRLSLLENVVSATGNAKSVVIENKEPVVTIKSDSQEFDITNNIITATGNVAINYKDLATTSAKARIQVDEAGKPRYVQLTGDVHINRENSTLDAATVIYNTATDEMIAQGSTKSTTIMEDSSKVIINANLQQYDKATGTLLTSGSVRLVYKDYIANGPKALFISDGKSTKPNKIILTGRSKIKETDRQVEANKIEITLDPKNFTAEGNVKTKFVQYQKTAPAAGSGSKGKANGKKKDTTNSKPKNIRKDFYNVNDVNTSTTQEGETSTENNEAAQ